MKFVLDATFLIDHLRGDPAAIARLDAMYAAGDDPIVTSVTSAEVWSGPRPGAEAAVEQFLTFLEYVHPGPATARLAGSWRAAARRRGANLQTTDALIAATAFDLDAVVLTRNVRDFALTPVRVETY